ncbi:ABC transporter ATP-binding protein [Streptomyces sp. WMMB 322]|uniref:ATP-binding cassette domain-containing protein n=1 Tax=Streptomyces sp. WMMB 322 TaxID=1286821 RepID=UPI000823B8C3|nr:ABC transporter ATP-binding protein [Streptomyces sp. WMMB 322]SCK40937.1 ATP-binding cassette, subfamily B [Streptomyces sp. WMMB 322]
MASAVRETAPTGPVPGGPPGDGVAGRVPGAGASAVTDTGLLVSAARHSAARTACLCLTSLLAAAATLLLPAVLGRALDRVLAGSDAGPWLALGAALTAALVLLDSADAVLTGTLNARSTAWLRTRLLTHILALGPGRAAPFTGGDLVTRGTGNAALAGSGPSAAATVVPAVAVPVGGLVALALLDLRLAAVLLAGMPVLALVLRAFTRRSADCTSRYQAEQARIAGRLTEALEGARTVAAAGTWQRERRRVLEPLPALSGAGHGMWRAQGRATAQAVVLVPLLQVAAVAVAGTLLAGGELSVGELAATARYAALAAGVGVLVGRLNALVRSRTAARRLAEVLAVDPPRHGSGRLPEHGPGRLEFHGVRGSAGERTVLDGVDLVVPGGATVALVGRSGSGKSLLAALAGRLAEPDAGRILLDGVELASLDRHSLRQAVGYAFARPALLGGSLGESIASGRPPAQPPGVPHAPGRRGVPRQAAAEQTGPGVAEWVVRAARAACADHFIRTLPEGYGAACETTPLSGGERQRLGLARAFVHEGRLLILDDATSSLDTVTELHVTEALFGPATTARTRLVVTHRASTAARADFAAWLDEGRVRAVGPHEELCRLPGYRALFTGEANGPEDQPAPGPVAASGAEPVAGPRAGPDGAVARTDEPHQPRAAVRGGSRDGGGPCA